MRKYLIIIVCSFFLVNCNKRIEIPGNPNNITGTLISQIEKDYFAFNIGSYWIYQDSLSGVFDTVKVASFTDVQISEPTGSKLQGPVGEEITTGMTSSFYDSTTYMDMTFYVGCNTNSVSVYLGRWNFETYMTGSWIYCGPPFPDSLFISYQLGNSSIYDTAFSYTNIITLHQNNQSIDSVLKSYDNYLNTYNINSHVPRGYLYFKRHMFIVRKEILTNGFGPSRVWILKQYHIIQ